MNRPLSALTSVAYKHVAKPIMFKQAPDDVHTHLVKTGTFVQSLKPVRAVLHGVWAYSNTEKLAQTYHGITFNNPVGLSAGFDKNFELAPLLRAVGFGFIEGGSLTFRPCAGNPRPWFHRLPKTKSIVVYAGLANQGVERIVKRLQKYPADTFADFPLNISVAKTNSPGTCTDDDAVADYVGSLRALKTAGVGTMITLNISCPNTYGGEPFTTPERLRLLLKEVDKVRLKQPVFIKMPSDLPWPEFRKLLEVAAKHKVAGVTISNLAKDRSTMQLADPLPDTVKGNMSGAPTWELSNNLIRHTSQEFGKRFTIIGVGGIFNAEDAYTKIRLGASLVELITGMIFEGPQLIGQINRGLAALLERDGFTNISEAIGIDAGA